MFKIQMTKTIKIKERKLTGSQDLRDKKPLDCPTGLYAYGQEARINRGMTKKLSWTRVNYHFKFIILFVIARRL